MKELRMKILETNTTDKLRAFAIAKRKDTVKASEFLKTPFTCDFYVLTQNTITETETGEVKEMECITLLGHDSEKDVCIGTNSPSLIKDFREIQDVINDMELDISAVKLQITQGKSSNGNKFNSIEIVF